MEHNDIIDKFVSLSSHIQLPSSKGVIQSLDVLTSALSLSLKERIGWLLLGVILGSSNGFLSNSCYCTMATIEFLKCP